MDAWGFDSFSPEENPTSPSNINFPDIPEVNLSNHPQNLLQGASDGPTPRTPSAYEVSEEAKRHEAIIQSRWMNKGRSKRVKILLAAWPEMPAAHGPDWDAFRRIAKNPEHDTGRFRGHFMWPYINQEDLAKGKLLPLFLNSRGRHSPSTFAAADADAMHLGFQTEALVPLLLNDHTLLLHGGSDAEYGRLDSGVSDYDSMFSRGQFAPGKGLLVLEAQARVLQFLVDCCHNLLQEIPQDALVSDAYPVVPEPNLRSDKETESSLAVMAAEAPYRLPANLDFEHLESLLEARTSAAEDHIWTLREDPGYWVKHVLETKDHRLEVIRDTASQKHPVAKSNSGDWFWARIVGSVVSESLITLNSVAQLSNRAKRLRSLKARYEAEIDPLEDLPPEYLKELLLFRHSLQQIARCFLMQLQTTVMASPPLRKFFVRETPETAADTDAFLYTRADVKMTKNEENLIWLLQTLWEDDTSLLQARLPSVVDELERLLESDPNVNLLISAHVINILGDLSLLGRIMHQIERYQPWARGFEYAALQREDDIEKIYSQLEAPIYTIEMLCQEHLMIDAAKQGKPEAGRFTYPCEKKRTQETAHALLTAESNLDHTWALVDEKLLECGNACIDAFFGGEYVERMPNFLYTPLWKLFSEPRSLRRTEEWNEPTEPTAREKRPEETVEEVQEAFSHAFLGNQTAESQRSVPETQPKIKEKTRGTAAPVEPAPEPIPEPVAQTTFAVDARALRVFRTIFHNPEVTSTPGVIAWREFLHAMTSLGFRAEAIYGSVWHFSPVTVAVERSIQIHEPHPSNKIPYNDARRIGRRLDRAYGWNGGMFVLKEN